MLFLRSDRGVSVCANSGCVWLITPPLPLPERLGSPLGKKHGPAGEAGTKLAHHSRIEMPVTAICRHCRVLYSTLGTSVPGKCHVRLSLVKRV
jgi:hypothetical protein